MTEPHCAYCGSAENFWTHSTLLGIRGFCSACEQPTEWKKLADGTWVETPCDKCDQCDAPATAFYGSSDGKGNSVHFARCKAHGITDEERETVFRAFRGAVNNTKEKT